MNRFPTSPTILFALPFFFVVVVVAISLRGTPTISLFLFNLTPVGKKNSKQNGRVMGGKKKAIMHRAYYCRICFLSYFYLEHTCVSIHIIHNEMHKRWGMDWYFKKIK